MNKENNIFGNEERNESFDDFILIENVHEEKIEDNKIDHEDYDTNYDNFKENYEKEVFYSNTQLNYCDANTNNSEESKNSKNRNTKKAKKSKVPMIAACVVGALCISATSSALTVAMMGSMYDNEQHSSNLTDANQNNSMTATQLNSQISQVGSEGAEVLTVPEIAEKVTPSVVGIETAAAYGAVGSGTGIIMNQEGYIITNQHVIDGAQAINVVLHTGEEFTATLIGEDSKTDLAVLKIDANIELTPAEFGNSDELVVGDLAIAIGNPGGLELQSSLTGGYVSAINRDMVIEDRNMTLIQTDAAINPGNSGGPLINEYGQVIGINTIKISASDYEGLGFAIPINEAMIIIDELVDNGHVTGRPAIGISGSEISQVASTYYNLPQGVMVSTVDQRSDAYEKGLAYGDIIVGVNGTQITTMAEINTIKENFKAGDTITLNIYRSGQELDINVVLMDELELTESVPQTQQSYESYFPRNNR